MARLQRGCGRGAGGWEATLRPRAGARRRRKRARVRHWIHAESERDIDFTRVKPLVCGEPHRRLYGETGYENAGHWCNLALRRPISMLVEAEKLPAAEARRIVLANLVPGVVVMPSGIFAVTRAQEAGCQYLRAT